MNDFKNHLIYYCEVIFLKIIKRISNFFDNISHDIRLFNLKPSLIVGAVTLCLGIASWIIGGRADKVTLFFLLPRSAISIGFMYFLWFVSFAFVGIVLGGVLFGCEKFKRREASKAITFIILSFIFTLCIYPIFFKCLAPFITLIFILVSAFFCFLAIMSCIRMYSLWTLCLMIHLLWLFYNGYLSFAIALIN